MSNLDLYRRLGTFELDRDFILEFPMEAYNILTTVAIIDVQYHMYSNKLHYTGFSFMFEPTSVGQIPNKYRVSFNGSLKPVWEKIDG